MKSLYLDDGTAFGQQPLTLPVTWTMQFTERCGNLLRVLDLAEPRPDWYARNKDVQQA